MKWRRVAVGGAVAAAAAAAFAGGVRISQTSDEEGDSGRADRDCARLLDRVQSGEREYADYLAADTIPAACVPEAKKRGMLDEVPR
ncbi:hypothetical protein MMF93_25545 [Streptomyces tubbatahanensis]|uniref:Secreted protein n=1 Tax=Streptomyces tubbatahanensis TaxID=2923272 RepID=A0ABY3XYU5_9ACTN|nr:hypothetical protein [Streptomyces tubbatahanensis]UNS99443.1 hypothetical protein MMF93_25545 [Streptomyces tubbatahanensis]